jgi:hypothetical protein
MVKHELQGYQVGRFSKEPVFGVIDLPMFGLRFKLIPQVTPDDDKFRVITITAEEDFDTDELFLELVSSGYLFWLRNQRSTHGYLNILSHRNRWKLILDAAKKRALQTKKGEFRTQYLNQLSRENFMDLYHRDPTVFDWMLL